MLLICYWYVIDNWYVIGCFPLFFRCFPMKRTVFVQFDNKVSKLTRPYSQLWMIWNASLTKSRRSSRSAMRNSDPVNRYRTKQYTVYSQYSMRIWKWKKKKKQNPVYQNSQHSNHSNHWHEWVGCVDMANIFCLRRGIWKRLRSDINCCCPSSKICPRPHWLAWKVYNFFRCVELVLLAHPIIKFYQSPSKLNAHKLLTFPYAKLWLGSQEKQQESPALFSAWQAFTGSYFVFTSRPNGRLHTWI